MSDVRFIVNGKNFFASSTILSQRSSYFTNVFSGQWTETNHQKEVNANKTTSVTSPTSTIHYERAAKSSQFIEDPKNYRLPFKYTIRITDFHPETFQELLRYFYTNEVIFNEASSLNTSPFDILLIADKYLVTDLCEIAKAEVLRTLSIENSAMILFSSAGKWPDLKEKALQFVIRNFSKVRETRGFDYVMDNYSMFSSNFGDIMKEIMKSMMPKSHD